MCWVFGITAAALFMTALDNLVVVTALPVIKGEFGASLTGLEWTVNAYTIPFALLLLPGVALADRYGVGGSSSWVSRYSLPDRPPPLYPPAPRR